MDNYKDDWPKLPERSTTSNNKVSTDPEPSNIINVYGGNVNFYVKNDISMGPKDSEEGKFSVIKKWFLIIWNFFKS